MIFASQGCPCFLLPCQDPACAAFLCLALGRGSTCFAGFGNAGSILSGRTADLEEVGRGSFARQWVTGAVEATAAVG